MKLKNAVRLFLINAYGMKRSVAGLETVWCNMLLINWVYGIFLTPRVNIVRAHFMLTMGFSCTQVKPFVL